MAKSESFRFHQTALQDSTGQYNLKEPLDRLAFGDFGNFS